MSLEEWESIERRLRWRYFAGAWMVAWWLGSMHAMQWINPRYHVMVMGVGILIATTPFSVLDEGWRQHLKSTAVYLPSLLAFGWIVPLAQPDWPWMFVLLAGVVATGTLTIWTKGRLWPITIWSVCLMAMSAWWFVTMP